MNDTLSIISEAYKSNRSAFSHGKCRYRYSKFRAESVEEALYGQPEDWERVIARESVWYFTGDQMTIKTVIDKEELYEKMKGNQPVLTPINIAKKDNYAIDHDGLINTAIVYSPEHYDLNVSFHPFNLAIDNGHFDPATWIDDAQANQSSMAEFSVEENVIEDGHRYILLKKHQVKPSDLDLRFYIDPNRGYLPFITEFRNDGKEKDPIARMRILEVHEESGSFFPMRAVYLAQGPPAADGSPTVSANEMKVLELDLEYQPTPEDLTVQLPRHTQFSDGINTNTAKTLFRNQAEEFASVSVNDIEGIYNSLQGIAKERIERKAKLRSRDQLVQSSGRSTNWKYILLSINAGFAILLAGLFYWKKKRASPEQ